MKPLKQQVYTSMTSIFEDTILITCNYFHICEDHFFVFMELFILFCPCLVTCNLNRSVLVIDSLEQSISYKNQIYQILGVMTDFRLNNQDLGLEIANFSGSVVALNFQTLDTQQFEDFAAKNDINSFTNFSMLSLCYISFL